MFWPGWRCQWSRFGFLSNKGSELQGRVLVTSPARPLPRRSYRNRAALIQQHLVLIMLIKARRCCTSSQVPSWVRVDRG